MRLYTVVTTMPSLTLIDQLRNDYQHLTFEDGNDFAWQPNSQTIIFNPIDQYLSARLLHELAHAHLGHTVYSRDIDLIAMERDAWALTRSSLGPKYGITIDGGLIQSDMDTYRDWLHARATCPKCQAVGLQIQKQTYRCLSCRQQWQVNEAKMCRLRRIVSKQKNTSL